MAAYASQAAAYAAGHPWWNAPAPFADTKPSRRVEATKTQAQRLRHVLNRFCKSGGKVRPSKADYARPHEIAPALNAYNARTHGSLRAPWAYFHPTIVEVPEAPGPGFNWASAPLNFPTNRGESAAYARNLRNDLSQPWNSVANPASQFHNRWNIHYRLLCFIHCQRDPAAPNDFYKHVYSMTVYDRETDELAWHDFSEYRRAERTGEIQQFWANVVHNFPIQIPPVNGLRTVQYESLKQLNGMLHWELDPVVSQKSIFGLGLWLMNHIHHPAPGPPLAIAGQGPRPPDTIAVATASGNRHLAPGLMDCLWRTLRDNDESAPDYQGSSADTKWCVQNDFGMPEGKNPYLRRAVNRRLRTLYPWASPANVNWIPEAFLDVEV